MSSSSSSRDLGGRGGSSSALRFGGHFGVVNADELADFRELVSYLWSVAAFSTTCTSRWCSRPSDAIKRGIAERLRIEQLPLDFRRASDRVGEEIPEAQALAG